MSEKIQIILPPNAESSSEFVSKALYGLSKKLITNLYPDRRGAGLFGGEFGYGADHESDVFMMHHYCWCEKDECLWCGGCGCNSDKAEYFLDGVRIFDWLAANDSIVASYPSDVAKYGTPEYEKAKTEFDRSIEERNRRLKTFYPKVEHHCEPKGLMENRPYGNDWRPKQSAPHFWHKATGFKVWWYKWIGRDMELSQKRTDAEIKRIIVECLFSINAK